MSIAQRINDLAEAIGKALKETKANSASDTTSLMQLKNTVDSAGKRVRALKELAESLLISLHVVGTDPGVGSELATQHGLMVVDGFVEACPEGSRSATVTREEDENGEEKIKVLLDDPVYMLGSGTRSARALQQQAFWGFVIYPKQQRVVPNMSYDINTNPPVYEYKNVATGKEISFYGPFSSQIDDIAGLIPPDEERVCLEFIDHVGEARASRIKSSTDTEKTFTSGIIVKATGDIEVPESYSMGPNYWRRDSLTIFLVYDDVDYNYYYYADHGNHSDPIVMTKDESGKWRGAFDPAEFDKALSLLEVQYEAKGYRWD